MFKKINTRTLIIILIILGVIVAINKYRQSNGSENTFNSEFLKIDTSAVTQIFIYPKAEKGKEIKLTKTGSNWELQNDKMKTIADADAIRSLISNFAEIKSLSLAGNDKSSWNDLQVSDSAGTRIKIITSDGKSNEVIVGKFGYNPAARSGMTYVRHAGEEQTYAINGMLSFNVNQGFNSWRNKKLLSGNKDNWTGLTFVYPGDSSFALNKQNNQWIINGQPADSAKTTQYLNELASSQSAGFVDHYTPASTPIFTLTIQGNNLPAPITIVAYPADSTQKYVLHSSINTDAYFSEAQSHLTERIFAGKEKFLK